MRSRFALPFSLLALLAGQAAIAETGYITDNLRLRMYATADLSGERVDTLQSGQQFEVLSRNTQTALIELPDGRQGYVSAAYIVFDKPATLVVAETQAEVDRLTSELADLRQSFAEPAAHIDTLRDENSELQARLADANARVEALQSDNNALAGRAEDYAFSLPYRWVGGAMLVCMIAGILIGLWWTDRQNRRRHGGIRVY